jgi:hypothetical protein
VGSGSAAPSGVKVWDSVELKKYDGSDTSLPLLLVVLGEVFDVTSGQDYYKKGESYNIFIGQDASASFHTGEWTKVEADVRGFSPQSLESVTGWRSFYRTSDKYKFAGVLEGLYYDRLGNPTDAFHEIAALEQEAGDATKYEETLTKRYPGCNMQSVTATKRTDIQCPAREQDKGIARVPRILKWTHKGSKAQTQRCACLTMAEIGNPQGLAPTMTSDPYPGCVPTESTCTITHA